MANNETPENTRTKLKELPEGHAKDVPDDQMSRWNRERHEGFAVGKFLYAPPMFFTQDHHSLWINDMYRGRSAFLILSGPSFKEVDKKVLKSPGILTMGVNNSPRTFRPNLWTSVDSPDHFMRSIWLDPTIMKFVPICHAGKHIFHNDAWKWLKLKVGDCPNVVYFRRNEKFQSKQFLNEDTMNWGNHKKYGGGRSVMLLAMRILYLIGIRRVFLLGADFNMDKNKPDNYHFPQERKEDSIHGNMSTYKKLNQWFTALRPVFDKEGFNVFNCNPKSGLTAFDHVPFDTAIDRILGEWGHINIRRERTEGLYDSEKPSKSEMIG